MSKKNLQELIHSLANDPFNIDCSTVDAAIFAADIVNYLQATNWIIYETSIICGGDFVEIEFKKRIDPFFFHLNIATG